MNFELDIGFGLTVMNKACFKATWKDPLNPELKPVQITLKTYTGKPIKLKGPAYLDVMYHQQRKKLPLIMVKQEGPNLLGRGLLEQITLCWGEIRNVIIKEYKVTLKVKLQEIMHHSEEVFKKEFRNYKLSRK